MQEILILFLFYQLCLLHHLLSTVSARGVQKEQEQKQEQAKAGAGAGAGVEAGAGALLILVW